MNVVSVQQCPLFASPDLSHLVSEGNAAAHEALFPHAAQLPVFWLQIGLAELTCSQSWSSAATVPPVVQATHAPEALQIGVAEVFVWQAFTGSLESLQATQAPVPVSQNGVFAFAARHCEFLVQATQPPLALQIGWFALREMQSESAVA